jgi:multiple sugar transport system substrate-binding protein
MKMRRRSLLRLLFAAVSSLAFCAAGTDVPIASATGVQMLTMWARADDVTFLPQLVKSFNATHSTLKISLTLVPDAEVDEKYALAASTGSGPDLISTEVTTMVEFLPSGLYQNITSLVNSLPYEKYLNPAHLENATYQGKIYGIPFTGDVSVLYWNKTLFSKAGLNPNVPPGNWAQIASDAKKIRDLGGDTYGYFFSGACAGCMAFTMLPYMWADGGNILTGSNTAVGHPTLYPNPALEATLSFYRQLWQSGVVAPTAKTENGTNQFGLFFAGTIGMFVQGTYPYAVLKSKYPNVKFGVEPVMSESGSNHGSYVGGDNLSITRFAKPGAKTALLWFASQGERELASLGVLPTRSDIADVTYASQDPRQAVFVKAASSFGHTPKSSKTAAVFFDNTGPFGQMVSTAIFGTDSIASAMKAGQQGALQLMGQ